MTFLRHAPRHVHQSVVDYLTEQLQQLGWLTAGSVPFGAAPITIVETRPFVGGQLDNKIGPGVVSVTIGSEQAVTEEELGGPLVQQEFPIFCDVFMDQEGTALALSTDVRDAFLGRHPTAKRSIPVTNQVTGDPEPDWRIYFEDIQRISPEHTFPLSWQSVHVTAAVYFKEVVY